MNRLNDLLKAHTSGTINESDYPEFIESLVNVLNEQGEMLTYYGEQLMTIKAENALLKQQIINKRVN